MDSNQRTHSDQIYSLTPLTTRPPLLILLRQLSREFIVASNKKRSVNWIALVYSDVINRDLSNKIWGYIEMSDPSRNRRIAKKGGKSPEKSGSKPNSARRSKGMRPIQGISSPRKPGNNKSDSRSSRRSGGGKGREGGAGWIWGFHAVKAALSNPRRTIHDIYTTENTLSRLQPLETKVNPRFSLPSDIDRMLPKGAVHQGIAIKAAPLEWPDISDIAMEAPKNGVILVLDQITDPHNVGAMLRLASAFGVSALVMQSRHAPPLAGATAKVAVGCLETIPVCLVTNIGNTLQDLAKTGWFITGLAGETELELADAVKTSGRHVIVMGAEGPGLRARVRKCCDQLAKIPMASSPIPGQAESLNVATAAAIALYEVRRTAP